MRAFPVDLTSKPRPSFADGFDVDKHKGIDIFAPEGTQVLAVDDGQVRTSQEAKGGTVAYLTAGDVKYFYGHLSQFLGGSPRQVKAGEVIGFVGTTGNAINRPPHVHFQVMRNGAVDNPFPELVAAAGGKTDITAPGRRSSGNNWAGFLLAFCLAYAFSRSARS